MKKNPIQNRIHKVEYDIRFDEKIGEYWQRNNHETIYVETNDIDREKSLHEEAEKVFIAKMKEHNRIVDVICVSYC